MKTILVTGANGFVGHELIQRLKEVDAGVEHSVLALVRKEYLHPLPEQGPFQVIQGDLLDYSSLPILPVIDTAYYLVHGLKSSDRDFEYEESLAAVNFLRWIKKNGCKKIIYLGGLGPDSHSSPHLRSRQLTGKILASSEIPCIEFRASIVLAAGSTSFEMIKALSERIPFSAEFQKIENYSQPLDLDDLMNYLISAMSMESQSMVLEIGGQDKISYLDLMNLYLKLTAKSKKKIRIPDLDDRIFKKLLDFIIPEMAEVGKKLFESLEYSTVVKTTDAQIRFPAIQPMSAAMAMQKAVRNSQTVYSPLWKPEMILFLIKENVIRLEDVKTWAEYIPQKQRTMIEMILKGRFRKH